ncbi:aminoglycoside phosphotransferase family protein [Nonomuraea ceibae]|uniref:aminoglycoside phosphotransferase family protein n=1 Tax=Nonomuraea ceibae TaxID=1935170 RepID=UPI001C600E3D|nr:aminoglycoside phosphotransferase family protein [Nonomuraea ceibae]
MADGDLYGEMRAILDEVGERLRMPMVRAELLRLHSNALFVLPSKGLLVRIATNPDALNQIASSVGVTRWLAELGFPCVVPAEVNGQPFVIRGRVVSFWRYVDVVATPAPSMGDLGEILCRLHLQPAPVGVDQFVDPLGSVALAIETVREGVSPMHRDWLRNRIAELRLAWKEVAFPHPLGLIHGDAHPNNLMRESSGRVVLGDWDHVAVGPREWDLMQIHYMHRRFSRVSRDQLDEFTDAYGWDIRDWPGLNLLIAVRELNGLSPYIRTAGAKEFSRTELARRLDSLREGDTTVRWSSPPAEGLERLTE